MKAYKHIITERTRVNLPWAKTTTSTLYENSMKCHKVKNPCKICLQTVTNKNGLQCQGACRKWAHFKCLNYTPGKIQDIKAGAIKVTCPCPDCNAGMPKEILTVPPITRTNTQHPANKVPALSSSTDCPNHDLFPQSFAPQKSSCSAPDSPCQPPRSPGPPSKQPPCSPPRYPPYAPPKTQTSNTPPKKNSSTCLSSSPSWQRIKNAVKLFSPKQSKSCYNVSKESNSSGRQIDKTRSVCSDSNLPSTSIDAKMLFAAIESLCSTVGELSSQLRNLMCEMHSGYGS